MGSRAHMMAVALVLVACDGASSRPCGREMERLHRRETQRIHGLSQNDDLSEAVHNLRAAAQCARDRDAEEVAIYALMLQSRLVARGDIEGLKAAARVLGEAGLPLPAVPAVNEALETAGGRLTRFARALKAEAGSDPDANLRAVLASSEMDPEDKSVLPITARALINHSDRDDACFTLVNHQELPSGTAMASLKREGKSVPLSGESTTFGASKGKPRLLRYCTTGPLRTGDIVQVHMGGRLVWQQILVVEPGDEVRGAFTRGFEDRDVAALCTTAKGRGAKLACEIAQVKP